MGLQRTWGTDRWWLPCLAVTTIPTLAWLRAAVAGLLTGSIGTDFCNFYTAAIQFERHAFYDSGSFLPTMRELVYVSSGTARDQPAFVQPPHAALLLEPFTELGPTQAFNLYFAIALVATIAGTWLFFEQWPLRSRLLACALMPFSWLSLGNLFSGSDTWLVYLGAALVWHGRTTNKATATAFGLCLALVKPQIGIWLLLIVASDGAWRQSGARWLLPGALTVWLAAPLAITGNAGLYGRFAHSLLTYQHGAQANQPNARGILELLVGERPATALAALVAVAGAAGILRVVHRARLFEDWRRRWLLGMAIALFVTPFDHSSEVWLLLPLVIVELYPAGPDRLPYGPSAKLTAAWWYWLLFPGVGFFVGANGGFGSAYYASYVLVAIAIGAGRLDGVYRATAALPDAPPACASLAPALPIAEQSHH